MAPPPSEAADEAWSDGEEAASRRRRRRERYEKDREDSKVVKERYDRLQAELIKRRQASLSTTLVLGGRIWAGLPGQSPYRGQHQRGWRRRRSGCPVSRNVHKGFEL